MYQVYLRSAGLRPTALMVLAAILAMVGGLAPSPVRADITCYDFTSPAEAQAVYDALPGEPFGIDTGWPEPGVVGGGDQEAGNGIACDATEDIPERKSPGNEHYAIGDGSTKNGREDLPDGVEEATVREARYAGAIQTEENPDKTYVLMGIATPEYEIYADYEEREVLGQCGAAAATARLQELLAPGTTVWLEVDKAGFYTRTELDRHLWVEQDGRYRLVSEILVTEGHAVVATDRPGTGRGDAWENPPVGARYRNALRKAQERAIEERVGRWEQCAA